MKKVISICLTLLMLIMAFQSIVFATGGGNNVGATDTIRGKTVVIVQAISWAGYAIALGMLIYIGIKYVTSAANEKADLKQAIVKYLIGAFLIGGASFFAQLVSTFAAGGAGNGLATSILDNALDAAGASR